MTTQPLPALGPMLARPGEIAVLTSVRPLLFTDDNPLTEANCLLCEHPIGMRAATIIGAAALAGRPCICGGIVSDVFLVHHDHFPVEPIELQAALNRGLKCPNQHQ